VYKNTERLGSTFIPRQFNGDLLLFTATQCESVPPTERWRPHVRGRIDIHPIACRHGQMTQPGPIAEVGRVLAIELEKRRTIFKWANNRAVLPLLSPDASKRKILNHWGAPVMVGDD
jgi:hypothetical protein